MNLIGAWMTAKKGKEIYHHRYGSITKSYDPDDLIRFICKEMKSDGILAYNWEVEKEKKIFTRLYMKGIYNTAAIEFPTPPEGAPVKVTFEWEE